MIIHENHRYHYYDNGHNYGSFEIPNGLALLEPEDGTSPNLITLGAPDGSFLLKIQLHTSDQDARSFLEETFDAYDSYEQLTKIFTVPSEIVDVTGYGVAYCIGKEILEEYVFDLKGTLMNFWFWKLNDRPYDEELYVSSRKELFDSIRLES